MHRERRLPPVVEQIVGSACGQRGMEPVGEAVDPRRRRIVRPVAAEFRQIVRHAAAADDQHALLPQRRERAPHAKMVLGPQMRLQRKLQHGNVGLRIHQQ